MKKLAVLIAPLLCFAAGAPSPIESAVDMARGAPGEFAADGMIRIAALEEVPLERKVTLLEDAFRRAAEAQDAYKRRAAITKVMGSAGFLNRAYDQDLDAMTLRVRVVEAMLPLSKTKARNLFRQIPPIQLPKLTCSDFLVYDVSRYYDLLGRIAAEAFTPKEVEKGEPFRLLLQHASAITSPSQVIPMAKVIASSHLKDADFQALVAAYAGALGGISGDDRSFTHAQGTGPQILALVDEMKTRKLSQLALLESYRLYLVKNLTASRCADDDLMINIPQSFALADAAPTPVKDAVDFFNQALRVPPLQLIEEAEVTPGSPDGKVEGLRSCEDADCQAIAQQYRGLVFQPSGNGWTTADRKSGEWQAKLQDFLTALSSWKESSEAPAAQYFRNKCGIYSELLGLVPTLENQEAVIRSLLDFVQRSKFQAESRVQWFLPVNALLGRATLDPTGLGKLMPEFRQSHDAVIALYAQLEAVAPRGPERVMPLL